jgi:hypothetical protein
MHTIRAKTWMPAKKALTIEWHIPQCPVLGVPVEHAEHLGGGALLQGCRDRHRVLSVCLRWFVRV